MKKQKEDELDKQKKAAEKKGKAKALEAKLEKEKKFAEEQTKLAQKLADKGHKLREEDLSQEIQVKLSHLRNFEVKICSKCHWSSGCLQCDYEKALRYHIKAAMPEWLEKKKAELDTAA